MTTPASLTTVRVPAIELQSVLPALSPDHMGAYVELPTGTDYRDRPGRENALLVSIGSSSNRDGWSIALTLAGKEKPLTAGPDDILTVHIINTE